MGQINFLTVRSSRSSTVSKLTYRPAEIIPKFIMLLRRGLKLPLQGAGDGRRRYLHAADAANAFNVLLHQGVAGEVYNLGSDDEITHRKLCEKLLELVRPAGYDSSKVDAWIDSKPGRPYVDSSSLMDCSKIRALGWEQKIRFDDGLRRTVQWYSAYGDTWWGGAESAVIPAA